MNAYDEIDAIAQKEFGQFDCCVDTNTGFLYFFEGVPVGELKLTMTFRGLLVEAFNFKNKLREKND